MKAENWERGGKRKRNRKKKERKLGMNRKQEEE